jgi:NAD(P)-dependent dehydrogenase (short-subunit alcohol dehydrogenase family)
MARPVMIVTGGGRGIGAATPLLAASRGYAVCVNYRSDAAAAQSVMSVKRGGAGGAIVNVSSMASRLAPEATRGDADERR